MKTIPSILLDNGIKSLGLLGTLWIDKRGRFIAGLYKYQNNLLLCIKYGNKIYGKYVSIDEIEKCLRNDVSLFQLMLNNSADYLISNNGIQPSKKIDKLVILIKLIFQRNKPITNHYYLWNEYVANN